MCKKCNVKKRSNSIIFHTFSLEKPTTRRARLIDVDTKKMKVYYSIRVDGKMNRGLSVLGILAQV